MVPLEARMRPPGSKSLTNRALVCAALARGTSTLAGVLDSEDTRVMIDGTRSLGSPCMWITSSRRPKSSVAAGRHRCHQRRVVHRQQRHHGAVPDGDGHARSRHVSPARHAADARAADPGPAGCVAQLGVRCRERAGTGCPPVVVHASGLPGRKTAIRGDISSQFLSGLLMAAPRGRGRSAMLEIAVDGPLVSKPYVRNDAWP